MKVDLPGVPLAPPASMRIAVLIAIGVAQGCSGAGTTVRPDETSVEGHQREAARERTLAASAPSGLRGSQVAPTIAPPAGPLPSHHDVEDPKYERRWRLEHAHDHERAAAELERAEARECRGIEPPDRRACPALGPAVAIRDLRGGVRVELAVGAALPRVVTALRCHQAFARARGFDPRAATCPLDLRGVELRASADGRAIEIVGANRRVARQIQQRVRRQVVLAGPAS